MKQIPFYVSLFFCYANMFDFWTTAAFVLPLLFFKGIKFEFLATDSRFFGRSLDELDKAFKVYSCGATQSSFLLKDGLASTSL